MASSIAWLTWRNSERYSILLHRHYVGSHASQIYHSLHQQRYIPYISSFIGPRVPPHSPTIWWIRISARYCLVTWPIGFELYSTFQTGIFRRQPSSFNVQQGSNHSTIMHHGPEVGRKNAKSLRSFGSTIRIFLRLRYVDIPPCCTLIVHCTVQYVSLGTSVASRVLADGLNCICITSAPVDPTHANSQQRIARTSTCCFKVLTTPSTARFALAGAL
jgi:hypothetical protein